MSLPFRVNPDTQHIIGGDVSRVNTRNAPEKNGAKALSIAFTNCKSNGEVIEDEILPKSWSSTDINNDKRSSPRNIMAMLGYSSAIKEVPFAKMESTTNRGNIASTSSWVELASFEAIKFATIDFLAIDSAALAENRDIATERMDNETVSVYTTKLLKEIQEPHA
jgi:hypothetical protein